MSNPSIRVKVIDGVAYAHMNDLALHIEWVAKEMDPKTTATVEVLGIVAERLRAAAHQSETSK